MDKWTTLDISAASIPIATSNQWCAMPTKTPNSFAISITWHLPIWKSRSTTVKSNQQLIKKKHKNLDQFLFWQTWNLASRFKSFTSLHIFITRCLNCSRTPCEPLLNITGLQLVIILRFRCSSFEGEKTLPLRWIWFDIKWIWKLFFKKRFNFIGIDLW